MQVSVVIPAFNHWELTKACVERLLATTARELLADVIVVDDGSNDGVSAAWTAAGRVFTPLLSPHNRGFSAACNSGATVASGELLFFLNNDAFPTSGSIAALRATLRADASIGIAGAKLLYADGSLQHAGLALLDGPVSRWWHLHRQLPGSLPDAAVARDLPAVTGAALMIRRPLFEALGGFDAGYTNGWEDVDLCLRAWCRGARVRYEPQAVMEHLESSTLGRTHDDSANEARFTGRWSTLLAALPRYPLPEIPPIALAMPRAGASDDRWARDHVRHWWGAHFGAKVSLTRPASRIDRVKVELDAALAKRRPTLEVAWGDAVRERATGPVRAAFVAPPTAADARAYVAAHDVAAWWTPTAGARDALVAAGAPLEKVVILPFGADTRAEGAAARSGEVVVAARAADADLLRAINARAAVNARAPRVRTIVLHVDDAVEFWAVDILVGRRRVVVSPPIDPSVAATPGISVVAEELLLEATLAQCADAAQLRATSPAVRRAATRRLDAALAAQRAAQTARALMHGTPSASLVEVGPALAAHFRRTALGAYA
jgi:GT2 family glycosyltransferase